jgi:hypothetical protein
MRQTENEVIEDLSGTKVALQTQEIEEGEEIDRN